MAQGLTYAAARGVRVANISSSVAATSSSVLSAAQYMKNKGGLVFVSAGNTGVSVSTAPTTTMIPVSATDSNDAKASWSNYGDAIDLAAPGVSIYSTTTGGGYANVSGTSFSSPITAATVALMIEMSDGSSRIACRSGRIALQIFAAG
jgi:subtilisin family serine protease